MTDNPPTPIVLIPGDILLFMQYVLSLVEASTIVICSSREAFLDSLLRSTQCPTKTPPRSDILEPTVELIDRASSIKVVFCTTLQHLRVFLSTYTTVTKPDSSNSLRMTKPDEKVPALALLNVINLHRETSEFSAQGIGRTFAAAIEAALYSRRQLVICECSPKYAFENESEGQFDIWEEQIQIMNDTYRTSQSAEAPWMTSTITIRRIIARWCSFKSYSETI